MTTYTLRAAHRYIPQEHGNRVNIQIAQAPVRVVCAGDRPMQAIIRHLYSFKSLVVFPLSGYRPLPVNEKKRCLETGEIRTCIHRTAHRSDGHFSVIPHKYNEISEFYRTYNEPVYITKNGTGDLVVLSNAEYERLCGKHELDRMLEEGYNSVGSGHGRPASEVFRDIENEFGFQ